MVVLKVSSFLRERRHERMAVSTGHPCRGLPETRWEEVLLRAIRLVTDTKREGEQMLRSAFPRSQSTPFSQGHRPAIQHCTTRKSVGEKNKLLALGSTLVSHVGEADVSFVAVLGSCQVQLPCEVNGGKCTT